MCMCMCLLVILFLGAFKLGELAVSNLGLGLGIMGSLCCGLRKVGVLGFS